MPSTAPLQVLLFRHPNDSDVEPYEQSIVRAFQGGKEAGGYLATGEDLGVQLEVFSGAPLESASQTLDNFCHTLALVFVDRAMLDKGDDGLWTWLAECWTHCDKSKNRHAMVVVPMDERIGDSFARKRTEFKNIQLRPVQEFGERALRPAMIALLALHECRILLSDAAAVAQPAGQPAGYLRLFISHAKMDGLPLAHALRHQIQSIGWLRSFYDADDLPPGCNWQRELERGVGSSLIVMLRTEAYDGRYWCQQEVRWADEYATPAVLVDARTALSHPAASLPFDRVPTVRIPDGNLLRILFLALREGLRFLWFVRLVQEMKLIGSLPASGELRVFSYAPSMPALLKACRSLPKAKSGDVQLILYPDPPLRAGVYEAAQALVAAYAPAARLVTPNTLAATGAGTP